MLTNTAQTAMTATDVLVLGRLGADALASSALGVNLYFAGLIFGLGLVTATAPMVARELGRNRHSVRDVRRTVRQGLWSAVAIAIPLWVDPVVHREHPRRPWGRSHVSPKAPASMSERCNGRSSLSSASSSCAL